MYDWGPPGGKPISTIIRSFLNDLNEYLSGQYNGLTYVDKLFKDCEQECDVDNYKKILLLLHADDTIILAESAQELQKAINGMYQYCKHWKLEINITKTKIMVFSRGKIRNLPNITFGVLPLEVVYEYTYLGVTFNYNGTFGKAIQKLHNTATKAMFSIIKKSRRLQLDIDTQIHLFNSMVVPIMLYGSEIWGYSDLKLVKQLQLKFGKIILNAKKSTTNAMVLGELGTYPLEIIINTRIIGFWTRLVKGIQNKFSYRLYTLLCRLNDASPWLKNIKTILNNSGLTYIWNSQCTDTNVDWLKQSVQLSYKDQFLQQWQSTIQNSRKCDVYRLFKTQFLLEPYLINVPFKLRNYLTKFRCRSSRIPVEAGIFFSVEREDRICKLCSCNTVGDELHYIFYCPYFATDRNKYVKQCANAPAVNMKGLFNVSGPELIDLCKFIKCILINFQI